jgi:hypothetical protein
MALRLKGEVFNLPKEAKKNGAKGCDGQQGADDKNGQHWSSQTRTSGLNSIFNPGHGHLHRSPLASTVPRRAKFLFLFRAYAGTRNSPTEFSKVRFKEDWSSQGQHALERHKRARVFRNSKSVQGRCQRRANVQDKIRELMASTF